MTLKELAIGKSAVIPGGWGSRCVTTAFFGYGYDSGCGSYGGKVCTDGRPDGIAGTWI